MTVYKLQFLDSQTYTNNTLKTTEPLWKHFFDSSKSSGCLVDKNSVKSGIRTMHIRCNDDIAEVALKFYCMPELENFKSDDSF